MSLRAVTQLGWWPTHRFWLARRLTQLMVLGLFALGPWAGLWLLRGNLSGSVLLDRVPLTDPLLVLQSLAAGYLPAATALIGALIVFFFYAVFGGRLFCSWVCPINPLTDAAAWLRRRLNWRTAPRSGNALRYALLLAVLIASAVSGALVWELLNPVTAAVRGVLFGFGTTLWLLLAVVALDVAFDRLWCGRLCPLGSFYALIGRWGLIRVSAAQRQRCDNCMDCFAVCPEPQVLKGPLHGERKGIGPMVTAAECTRCMRCMDVCSEQVFVVTTRLQSGVENKQ